MKQRLPTPTPAEPITWMLPPKRKRDRKWEQQQRQEGKVTASYRLPIELRNQITQIAREIRVSNDELVRAFLEHSLADYHTGALSLAPTIKTGRYTLFANND